MRVDVDSVGDEGCVEAASPAILDAQQEPLAERDFCHHDEPSKHELIGAWPPRQAWFVGDAPPALEKVSGFRLDEPAGEVSVEFILVRGNASPVPMTYHVPLTYRGAALEGAESSLLGTSEHAVLGTRWIYAAEVDPVWHTRLREFAAGEVLAQDQQISHTWEPAVHLHGAELVPPPPGVPAHWIIIRRPEAEGTGQQRAGAWVSVPRVTAGGAAGLSVRSAVLKIA